MLTLNFPRPVKLIFAFIYPREGTYAACKKILVKKFGPIDYESEKMLFDHTGYYWPEMGKPLFRRFISFKNLGEAGRIIKIKLFALKLEKKFAEKKARTINIDPGYLNSAKLVLATTKDFSHRIYLGRGVYAEVTLFYHNGNFRHYPTTFTDYRRQAYKNIFQQIRNIYSRQNK